MIDINSTTKMLHEYIDMGTGSIIVQVLIASSVGVLYIVREWIGNTFQKIKDKFKKHGK